MNESVNFKKQRELGTILTDIFKFIRLNWKPLFGMIFKIAGPALLIMLGAYVFYMQSIVGGLGMLDSVGSFSNFSTNMVLAFIVLLLAGVVYYALLNGVVLHYIKSHINNNGTVVKEEVFAGVKNDFWKLIGTSFLVGLIVAVGSMFCVIPGIYLGVVLSVAYAVVVFEGKEVSDTISHCFNLVKDEWWITFATFLVVFLLYYFIMIIFQVPQYIYFFINALTMSQEVSADPSSMFDWVYITLTTIGMVFQYLLYSIIVICTAFVYFNLNEKKHFTGTMETIESIGK
ncbi:hypothetical protein [Aequorivita lipolytica]|uniref:Glycerophosphoryl diester phosphodiesterase membrane domain-containing protein n=1 Tax=Aequorivita lipolytica TaxID=153267 RepID=A0A5C6YRN1_9FLAO|nr:hypothetical protein [Aequorivita lipolytica]TXD69586.1 hypothetical protein ESV24_07045 [Aequorivita lipolytica]SRX51070.1 hypothetical protein AEQU2_01550 [Aequorivita lipolytica]